VGQFLISRSAIALKGLRRLPAQLPTPAPQDIRLNPQSAAMWLTLTPGDSSIVTASRLYSAENFRLCFMTPLLAHYGLN
jgi:hypothetical protein